MRVLWYVTLLLAISTRTPGSVERPCDLRILVEDFERRPIELPVALVTDGGQVIAKTRSVGGVAEVCDVGIKTFSAVVGSDICGQVVIRHLEVTGPQTLTLRASYKSCHGNHFQAGCTVLVRVMDEAGRRLEGGNVRVRGEPYGTRTDRYGREYLPMRYGTTEDIQISLAGYRSETVTVSCREDEAQIEKSVVLKREER
jgi:hypothetical protein